MKTLSKPPIQMKQKQTIVKRISFFVLILLLALTRQNALAQDFTQTIKGRIMTWMVILRLPALEQAVLAFKSVLWDITPSI